MRQSLRLNLYAMCQSPAFVVILVVLTGCNILFVQVPATAATLNGAKDAFDFLHGDISTLFCACGIYAGFAVCNDLQNGLTRYFSAAGMNRRIWLTGRYVCWLLGALCLLLADFVLAIAFAIPLQGCEVPLPSLIGHLLQTFLFSIPLYCGVLSLFFLVGVLVQNGGVTIAVNVILSLLAYASTRGTLVKINPMEHLTTLAQQGISDPDSYVVACAISVCICAVSLAGGLIRLEHQPLADGRR